MLWRGSSHNDPSRETVGSDILHGVILGSCTISGLFSRPMEEGTPSGGDLADLLKACLRGEAQGGQWGEATALGDGCMSRVRSSSTWTVWPLRAHRDTEMLTGAGIQRAEEGVQGWLSPLPHQPHGERLSVPDGDLHHRSAGKSLVAWLLWDCSCVLLEEQALFCHSQP